MLIPELLVTSNLGWLVEKRLETVEQHQVSLDEKSSRLLERGLLLWSIPVFLKGKPMDHRTLAATDVSLCLFGNIAKIQIYESGISIFFIENYWLTSR